MLGTSAFKVDLRNLAATLASLSLTKCNEHPGSSSILLQSTDVRAAFKSFSTVAFDSLLKSTDVVVLGFKCDEIPLLIPANGRTALERTLRNILEFKQSWRENMFTFSSCGGTLMHRCDRLRKVYVQLYLTNILCVQYVATSRTSIPRPERHT